MRFPATIVMIWCSSPLPFFDSADMSLGQTALQPLEGLTGKIWTFFLPVFSHGEAGVQGRDLPVPMLSSPDARYETKHYSRCCLVIFVKRSCKICVGVDFCVLRVLSLPLPAPSASCGLACLLSYCAPVPGAHQLPEA